MTEMTEVVVLCSGRVADTRGLNLQAAGVVTTSR